MRSPFEVLLVFARLGCLSFGGPVAHLAYFREELVRRRAWLDDETLAQCIAFTQLLPGPGSSQTGMLVGWLAGGPMGALAAWIGFTLPSAALMCAFVLWLRAANSDAGWLHGLLLVAAAVVANAVLTMRATLAPDPRRLALAGAAFAFVLAFPQPLAAPASIALAALAGFALLRDHIAFDARDLDLRLNRRTGAVILVIFGCTLVTLHLAARSFGSHALVLADELFRIGSLVFGGGHVVLPLLQRQVASAGVVDVQTILAGYAAAQAMPGPLFSIASYVGASAFDRELGIWGALLGTVAIFAPSFFLLAGIGPFYRSLSSNVRFRAALAGANAGVVGLLAAAFATPIWTNAVHSWRDAAFVAAAFVLVQYVRLPAYAVVIAGALAGSAIFK